MWWSFIFTQMEVMAKIYWGDAREILCEAVKDLKLDHLVVGSRGHSMMKRYNKKIDNKKMTDFFEQK